MNSVALTTDDNVADRHNNSAASSSSSCSSTYAALGLESYSPLVGTAAAAESESTDANDLARGSTTSTPTDTYVSNMIKEYLDYANLREVPTVDKVMERFPNTW